MERGNKTIRSIGIAALAGLLAGIPLSAMAQGSDLPVTTTRVRDGGVSGLPGSVLAGAKLSDQPRYYLDTIDNLSRIATDDSRKAPGLTKNNYVTRVYEVHNTPAIHIQSYLLRSLAYEGGVAEVMGETGIKTPDGKETQFLFVTAPDFMVPGIDDFVKKCDTAGFKFYDGTGKDFGGGAGAQQYIAKHRTASELKAILGSTELGNIGAFLFPPFADDSTNSIYVVDNPSEMADNMAALAMFDKPPLQVELEVNIYEINEGDRGKLGLDWDSWKRFTIGAMNYESPTDNQVLFKDNTDVYSSLLTMDARVFADFINFTVQTGTTKVITSTRITMVNSEDVAGGLSGGARGAATANPAVIESIVSLPFTTVQDDIGPTNAPNARNEVLETAFEGVRVEILPFIGTESITLQVAATVNSLVGYSKDTDVPIISTRNVNSVLNVRDGQPVVLGGLDKTNSVKSRVGVPYLKDIPILGYLFGKESKDTTKSKVLISIKPRIKTTDTPEASML